LFSIDEGMVLDEGRAERRSFVKERGVKVATIEGRSRLREGRIQEAEIADS
jgi:hypothetical protein